MSVIKLYKDSKSLVTLLIVVVKKASALYKPESLLGLFNKFIDLSNYIPSSFYNAYYKHFGKHRCFSLESMLLCFFVQKLLKLNTLTQLRAVLLNSYELRSFCNLNGNVPLCLKLLMLILISALCL